MTGVRPESPDRIAVRAVRDVRIPSVRGSEKAVLFAIASRLGVEGWTWATIETLSDDAGLAYSTTHAVIAWLRELGVVVAVDVREAGREGVIALDVGRLLALPADTPRRKITGGPKDSGTERRSSGIRRPLSGSEGMSSLRDPESSPPDLESSSPGSGVGGLRDPETKDPEKDPEEESMKGGDRALASAADGSPRALRPIALPLPGSTTAPARPTFELTPPSSPERRRGPSRRAHRDEAAKPPTKAARFREYRTAVEEGFADAGVQITAPDIRTGQDQIVRTLGKFAVDPTTGKAHGGDELIAWIRREFAAYARENPDPEFLYLRFANWIAVRGGNVRDSSTQRRSAGYGAQPYFGDDHHLSDDPQRDGTTG